MSKVLILSLIENSFDYRLPSTFTGELKLQKMLGLLFFLFLRNMGVNDWQEDWFAPFWPNMLEPIGL